MPTLTTRNVPQAVVTEPKLAAQRHQVSMDEEARGVLRRNYGGRQKWIEAFEAAWQKQSRTTTAAEIDAWKRQRRG